MQPVTTGRSSLLQADWYLAKLEPVVEALAQEVPDADYSRESLAQLIAGMLQFMEDLLGKDVSAARAARLLMWVRPPLLDP